MNFKICVSGAAEGSCVSPENIEKAKALGRAIAEHDCIIVTGATSGLPHYATIGAKEKKGVSIGFSPAATYQDHLYRYHLPTNYMDLIVYTGFGYSGRNLILTRSADAIITICGRIGTLNEFTVAFEDKKPLGVLTDSGGISDEVKEITEMAHKHQCPILYEDDPVKLVASLIADLKENRAEINRNHQPEKMDQPD